MHGICRLLCTRVVDHLQFGDSQCSCCKQIYICMRYVYTYTRVCVQPSKFFAFELSTDLKFPRQRPQQASRDHPPPPPPPTPPPPRPPPRQHVLLQLPQFSWVMHGTAQQHECE
uniref:Uncharacterized protein n=1 Tax=Eutreptiella gymnastica TaxID=73025 RepID=A0A7S4G904_9EUGL